PKGRVVLLMDHERQHDRSRGREVRVDARALSTVHEDKNLAFETACAELLFEPRAAAARHVVGHLRVDASTQMFVRAPDGFAQNPPERDERDERQPLANDQGTVIEMFARWSPSFGDAGIAAQNASELRIHSGMPGGRSWLGMDGSSAGVKSAP